MLNRKHLFVYSKTSALWEDEFFFLHLVSVKSLFEIGGHVLILENRNKNVYQNTAFTLFSDVQQKNQDQDALL